MPVEFQSHDLYSEDDFAVGELDSIPTENVQTFLLEFGAQWLKKGFIVTKEAQKELLSGPMRYDVIAANAASIATATAKSYPVPSLYMLAGEILIVIFLGGILNPLFFKAIYTRSLASFNSGDKWPTSAKQGSPFDISASTCIIRPSIPCTMAE